MTAAEGTPARAPDAPPQTIGDLARAVSPTLRRHPRHLCLAALVSGLLAPSTGAAIVLVAVAALMLAAASARIVALIVLFTLAGAAVAQWRLESAARAGWHPGQRLSGTATVLEPARARAGGARSLRVRWHGTAAAASARAGSGASTPDGARRSDGAGARASPLDGSVLVARIARYARWPAGVPVGAVVRVAGRLAPLPLAERYQERRGAVAMIVVTVASDTGRRRGGVAGALDSIRSRAERGLAAGLSPADAALARGLVLGQDERIGEAVREDFRRAGLSHVLAVSGQNVMLLALLALAAGTAVGLGLRARLLVALALVAVYVPLAGGGPSIQRAGVMGGAGLVAAFAGRPASRWYALGLAAAVTLAVNPRAAGDPGWQLSFAAVIALLALAAPLAGALVRRQWPRPLAEALAITGAATLGTAPLLAFHFGQLSLVSLPANVLAAPLVAPLMWLGMLAAAAGQLGSGAAEPFTLAAEPLLRALQALAHACAGVPGASAPVRIGSVAGVVVAYAVLVAAGAAAWWSLRARGAGAGDPSRLGRRSRRGLRAAAAGAMALVAIPLAWSAAGAERVRPVAPDELVVSFLDVGQGNSTLVQQGGASMLVDTGPDPPRLRRHLATAGIKRLDLLVITHASLDHDAGAVGLLRGHAAPLMLDGGTSTHTRARRAIEAAAASAHIHRIATFAGQTWRLGRARVTVVWPREAGVVTDDHNDGATVLLVSFEGFDLLLPADAEGNVTAKLPLPRLDAMLVAHHGSADTSLPRLLARTRPGIAVISVGAHNTYGHPTPSSLAALRAVPRLYRTDRDGTVRLRVRGGRLTVETTG